MRTSWLPESPEPNWWRAFCEVQIHINRGQDEELKKFVEDVRQETIEPIRLHIEYLTKFLERSISD